MTPLVKKIMGLNTIGRRGKWVHTKVRKAFSKAYWYKITPFYER